MLLKSNTWQWPAAAWIILNGLNPYVGWFALCNVAVLCCALYVFRMVSNLQQQVQEAMQLKKSLKKKDLVKLRELYAGQDRQLQTLAKIMVPFISAAAMLLNIYTFIFYWQKGVPLVSFFGGNITISWILLGLGLCAGVIYILLYMKEMKARLTSIHI